MLGVQYNILPSCHPSLALLASYSFYLLNHQKFSKSLHFLPLTGPTVPEAYFLSFSRFASPASQCFSHILTGPLQKADLLLPALLSSLYLPPVLFTITINSVRC